jgi:BlaI family transcriptional regulator, penicillinase repressor
MNSNISISEAESVVMEILWSRHPLMAEDIVATLGEQQEWQEATIKTLINRLLKKGAISAESQGRRYLYAPVLLREDWLHSQSAGLLDRLFDGRIAPLVAHFSTHRKLSKRDIAELKKLIQEMEK